jgi:hypothetical protein
MKRLHRIAAALCLAATLLTAIAGNVSATGGLPRLVASAGPGTGSGYLDRASGFRITIHHAAVTRGWVNGKDCVSGRPVFSVILSVTTRNDGKRKQIIAPEGSFFLGDSGRWLVGLASPASPTTVSPGQTRQWQVAFGPLIALPPTLIVGWRHVLPQPHPSPGVTPTAAPTPEQPRSPRPSSSIATFRVVGGTRNRCP